MAMISISLSTTVLVITSKHVTCIKCAAFMSLVLINLYLQEVYFFICCAANCTYNQVDTTVVGTIFFYPIL